MTEYAGKKQMEFPREDPVIKPKRYRTEKKKKVKKKPALTFAIVVIGVPLDPLSTS